MSLVHKILRRDNPNDDDGAESTATPPSETVPGRINIQQVLEQTREKEQRLKQGIERLRQQKAALQERLEAAERGLAQRDNDLERLRESAQRREEELLASIQELKDLLVDATTDLKHEQAHRGHGPAAQSPVRAAESLGSSLLARAKSRR